MIPLLSTTYGDQLRDRLSGSTPKTLKSSDSGQILRIAGRFNRPRYNRYGITDRAIRIDETRPVFGARFSRPPPSTTRPSLRSEMSPEIARLQSHETTGPACVTRSVTIATMRDTIRRPGDQRPLYRSSATRTGRPLAPIVRQMECRATRPAPGLRVPAPSSTYEPRRAAQRVLYRIVLEHFETFRAQAASIRDGDGLPRFVEQEFREFLGCGCWRAREVGDLLGPRLQPCPLAAYFQRIASRREGGIRRRPRLGGLLNYYDRAA